MSDITILVSTSPRPTHPSPAILDETIASIRQSLPDAPIIIMVDGIPDAEYTPNKVAIHERFLDMISNRYENSAILVWAGQQQQSGMLGRALDYVETPILCYVEDDWKISPNVEWSALSAIIQPGRANYIKLYPACRIHPLHEGMMVERVIWDNIPLIKTIQYSQNPHLASTAWYRSEILPRCIGQCEAIENLMHSPCACGPWERYKLCIYNPLNEGSMQMCRHLDGRRQP